MPALNPYAVLSVPPTATLAEITMAYRSLAQAEHPDKGGDDSRMAAINVAFQALAEPGRRAHTDRVLAESNPDLEGIKRLVAGKSHAEIRSVIADIRMHVRSFTDRDRWGRYSGPLNDPRLARHRKELAYLEGLLA